VRETLIINSRLAWSCARRDAAQRGRHGLNVLSIEQLAARLAGGFLQPMDSDALKSAVAKSLDIDLGELNAIKALPGFSRAAAATLGRAWLAGIDLNKVGISRESSAFRRIEAMIRLEAEVLEHIPPSMKRPTDLVARALTRVDHAPALFGRISVQGHTEMAPVWRPLLATLAKVVDVSWVAGPRRVPDWVRHLSLDICETPPETPEIASISCASPRHEALEALRWARSMIASGSVLPEEIAIAAASPEDWDDHMLALSEMSGLDVHFVHGRKVLTSSEGQLAAALAEVLLRGFSQARMTRLVGLLRNQNPAFSVVPGDWWRSLPHDAPLLDLARWREVLAMQPGPDTPDSPDWIQVLRELVDTIAFGLKRALEIGEHVLRKKSLAIWRKALTEGPPEALDVTLLTLRTADALPFETTIIWAPASSLASVPRPYVWLIGLTSRGWPRRHTEDPLLPNHVIEAVVLDHPALHEADRCDFDTIAKTTSQRLICSHARREAQGRINGVSPLYPRQAGATRYRQSRIPEHACGWADRLFARPVEFQDLEVARSAFGCWIDWHVNRLTGHDGLLRPNHPIAQTALDRRESTTSLVKLLRDPLGYLWIYGFGWQEPKETEEPLVLDALAFGNILHETLENAVESLESTISGGLGAAGDAAITAALRAAIETVAKKWELTRPVPPPAIWQRKIQAILCLARDALTYREEPLPGQKSWAEIRFGSDPRKRAIHPDDKPGLPWDPFTSVIIPGTDVAIGGSIDRLDVSGGGTIARVTDYKSGRAPDPRFPPVLGGGAELQRCLYGYAVRVLLPGVVQVEARLLYPRDNETGLLPLSNSDGVMGRLAEFINEARRHALAGDFLPGIGAQDEYNRLAFALPGGAAELYFKVKGALVDERLGGIVPLWEIA
jgi:hypothetical protein